MTRFSLLCAAATLAGLVPAAALAQEGGPCTKEIADLRRDLAPQVGLGAPVAEPASGLNKDPYGDSKQSASNTSNKDDMKGSTTGTVGASGSDKAQPGKEGYSKTAGGPAGTVGGVTGAVGANLGKETEEAVASGRIATSPADVRRQSENRPTMAEAAAKGGSASTSENLSAEDKVSKAKLALQQATDLNAKGDKSCMDYVKQAQDMMPRSGGGNR